MCCLQVLQKYISWRAMRTWGWPWTPCRCPQWSTRRSTWMTTVCVVWFELFKKPGETKLFSVWPMKRGSLYLFCTDCSVFWITVVCMCITALSMQILKPAGFMETSHYPLLLLVYVWARVYTHLCTIHTYTHLHKEKVCVHYQARAGSCRRFVPSHTRTLLSQSMEICWTVLIRHINLKTCCFVLNSSEIMITLWMRKLTLLSISSFH